MKHTLALVLMVFGSFGAFADIREDRLAAEKKAKLDCKDSLEYNKCIKASYYGVGNANQDKYKTIDIPNNNFLLHPLNCFFNIV